MKIYLGADHNGFHLKEDLEKYLEKSGYDVADKGSDSLDPNDDFPVFAARVATAVLASDDKDPRGILVCGSGQGVCMAANRFKGIRAAVGFSVDTVKAVRNDEDSNVLCIPAWILSDKEAFKIVDAWLTTPFAGAARFHRRNKQMDELG